MIQVFGSYWWRPVIRITDGGGAFLFEGHGSVHLVLIALTPVVWPRQHTHTHINTHINTDGLSRSNVSFFCFIKTSDPSYPRQDAAPCHRVCNQSRRAPVDSSICRKQETFFSEKEGRKKLWRKCWTSDHLMFLFFSWSWLDKCRKKNGAEKTVRAATATVIFVENVRGEKRRQADEGVSQTKLKYLK